MPIIESLGAIGGFLAGLGAIAAVVVAYWQLKELNKTLKMTGLAAVLSLEAEMNNRRVALDECYLRISQVNPTPETTAKVHDDLLQSAIQNHLNAADRLAFCINKGYFPEREWRAEYRDYFANLVKQHEDKFGASTPYRNLKDLHNKWQRE